MSAKARFFGLPTAVIDQALLLGAHADCLLFRTHERSCVNCHALVIQVVGVIYADVPAQGRTNAMRQDVLREQSQ